MLLSPIGTLPSAIDNPITVPTFKATAQDNDPMFTITAERGFLPRLVSNVLTRLCLKLN